MGGRAAAALRLELKELLACHGRFRTRVVTITGATAEQPIDAKRLLEQIASHAVGADPVR
jgi:hypothetical protein